ncbi:hypothetical protein M501DRAFT_683324 [Patellaria atrata CBS 101060]|uniref:Uncharacterized protein n=1 Tax=Patellaria atrata CBS 101060 TaxID=1346257 RepID=A0A9P4VNX2_9PEZI|nr:hypothetical protein M501DRAFT_683324 [Patellaria atrata CBS 101060]
MYYPLAISHPSPNSTPHLSYTMCEHPRFFPLTSVLMYLGCAVICGSNFPLWYNIPSVFMLSPIMHMFRHFVSTGIDSSNGHIVRGGVSTIEGALTWYQCYGPFLLTVISLFITEIPGWHRT